MKLKLFLIIPIVVLVLAVFIWDLVVGKSKPLTNVLQEQLIHSASFEVLALNPVPVDKTDSLGTNIETLLSYPILGSVKIDDQNLRREIVGAVSEDIANAKHLPTACVLDPRHGIRCIDGSNSVLMAICYRCGDVVLERNGSDEGYLIKMGGALRSPASKQLFDKLFREAGVKTEVK